MTRLRASDLDVAVLGTVAALSGDDVVEYAATRYAGSTAG